MPKALIIRIGRLGDTVLTTAAVDVIRRHLGEDAQIDYAASEGSSAAMLSLDQRIRHVYPVRHRRLPWPMSPGARALRRASRAAPYDLVVNLELGGDCDHYVQFVRHKRWLGPPHQFIARSRDEHRVDAEKKVYATVAESDVLREAAPRLKLPELPVIEDLPVGQPYVVVNPTFSGVSRRGYRGHRAWPLEHWATLIRRVHQELNLVCAVNAMGSETGLVADLLRLPGAISMAGASLEELLGTVAGARAVVSVDTGTMHLAAALNRPVIALFGPSLPRVMGPYPPAGRDHLVLATDLSCQPCFGTAHQKSCPVNRCMQQLLPERVFGALQRQLQSTV
ncbi:glycosyltransferase family 9 protein [Wenzhouxiangella sediminis]|uniref:Glycosyltransferase family 9 protein n=2 Tax=Wenzhouxiangella sediminis TaxID=1792836 RepID=A0A3E1KB74_9GAMM|nr:glycosyltransferase family 9 protein [Wenzhouxiangella sediminis]